MFRSPVPGVLVGCFGQLGLMDRSKKKNDRNIVEQLSFYNPFSSNLIGEVSYIVSPRSNFQP
jgi:hypothetical protein